MGHEFVYHRQRFFEFDRVHLFFVHWVHLNSVSHTSILHYWHYVSISVSSSFIRLRSSTRSGNPVTPFGALFPVCASAGPTAGAEFRIAFQNKVFVSFFQVAQPMASQDGREWFALLHVHARHERALGPTSRLRYVLFRSNNALDRKSLEGAHVVFNTTR